MSENGIVYLVGAGPGDPDLITVRGLNAIRKADVVAYDRLVSRELLTQAPVTAELIYVGKTPGIKSTSQDEINELLIDAATDGKIVVRLKGGDPFVFGRGGEEALALHHAGIRFEIVPGITSAVAAPAAAGIPVTHRNVARSFAVVTGHASDPDEQPDWSALSQVDTLVILMGLGRIESIAWRLIDQGRSPDTPAAVIQSATTSDQRTVVGDLSNIAAKAVDLEPPAVIVIGEVVRLHSQLGRWSSGYEDQIPAEIAGLLELSLIPEEA